MPSANVIKIVSAFLAGVIVALGSALIYVKTSDMLEPKPTVEAVAAPETPSPAVASLPDAGQSAPAVVDGSALEPLPSARKREAPISRAMSVRKAAPAVKKQPLQVAQNLPPAPTSPSAVAASPQLSYPAASQVGPSQTPGPAAPATPIQPATIYPVQPSDSSASSPYAALPPRQPRTVTIPAGTNLPVRLSQDLTSDRNQSGDTFRATLENPIILEGAIIADRGSRVVGRVVTAQKAGRVEGLADLTLALTEINTTDGQRVSVATDTYVKTGPKSTTQDAEKIGGGAALGAIIGAIAGGGKGAAIGAGAGGAAGTGTVLATRGKPAVLTSESRMSFRLSAPVTITERFNSVQ